LTASWAVEFSSCWGFKGWGATAGRTPENFLGQGVSGEENVISVENWSNWAKCHAGQPNAGHELRFAWRVSTYHCENCGKIKRNG